MVETLAVGSVSSVRVLLARASRRSLGWLMGATVLSCAARLLFVGTAYYFAHVPSRRESLEIAVFAAALFTLIRGIRSLARTSVQRDVYAMSARAVLATDVLAVPTRELRGVVLDGTYHAVVLVADLAPALVADLLATLVLLPLALATFEPRLLVIAGLTMAVVTVVAVVLRAMARRVEERALDAYASVIEALTGTIDGRLEIVARAGEDEVTRRFESTLDGYESVSRRSALGRAFLGRAPLAAGALAVALVVLLDASSRTAIEGALVTKALLLAAAVPALHGTVLGLHGMLRSLVFVGPLVDLLRGATPGPATGVRVELPATWIGRGLGFAYEAGGTAILNDVSFAWAPGAPLVLTGPNGSGKSTLLKLLLGLRAPSAGSIVFGGHDLSTIDLEYLRRQVAYLPQRSFLGEGYASVRSAIRLSVPNATDDEIRAALERTGVLHVLSEHGADALATPVGELSAGQRQRVALARVLLPRARMVLLDEPDANLDAAGISLVAALVRELTAEDVMVAVAAHTPELAAVEGATRLDLAQRV